MYRNWLTIPVTRTSMFPSWPLVSMSNAFIEPTKPCFKPSPFATTAFCPLAGVETTSILNGLPEIRVTHLI